MNKKGPGKQFLAVRKAANTNGAVNIWVLNADGSGATLGRSLLQRVQTARPRHP